MTLKVNLVVFFPDNTHSEKVCQITKQGKIEFDKIWKPQVKTGLSQFPERPKEGFWRLPSFRKRKTRYFGFYGEPECYTLSEFKGKLNANWDKAESQGFIKKAMAYALVEGKPFSTLQVYLLFGGMIAMILIGILILRRVGI